MKEHFAGQVFNSHIRENIRLAEAPSYKKAINTYNSKCGAATDFRSFQRVCLSSAHQLSQKPFWQSYHQRLFGRVDERFKSHAWKACVGL